MATKNLIHKTTYFYTRLININFKGKNQLQQQQNKSHQSSISQQINYKIKKTLKCQQLNQLIRKSNGRINAQQWSLFLRQWIYLRRIDKSDGSNMISIINTMHKQVEQMTPQNIIKILYSLKQCYVTKNDLILLQPIIEQILKQFIIIEPNPFALISINSNIKLFFSLSHLKQITGKHYNKSINTILKHIMYFLCQQNQVKDIPWYLLLHFLKTALKIQPSINKITIKQFIEKLLKYHKYMNFNQLLQTKYYLTQHHKLLIDCNHNLANMKYVHCNLLYRLHNYIYQNISQRNFTQVKPYLLMSYLNNLCSLSPLQIQNLNLHNNKYNTIIYTLLKVLHQNYSKYVSNNYRSEAEKEMIKKWAIMSHIQDNQGNSLLGKIFFMFFKGKLSNLLHFNIISQFNKLLTLCSQFFQQLSPQTQISMLLLISSHQINLQIGVHQQNTKSQLFRQWNFTNKMTIQYYLQLLNYYKFIPQINLFKQQQIITKQILKYFFQQIEIYEQQKINNYTKYLINYFKFKQIKIQQLLNIYRSNSQNNRCFNRKNIQILQSRNCKFMKINNYKIQNYKDDKFILDSQFQLRIKIRKKIQNCLLTVQLMLVLANQLSIDSMKSILEIFQDELPCLLYQNLFTGDNLELLLRIQNYCYIRNESYCLPIIQYINALQMIKKIKQKNSIAMISRRKKNQQNFEKTNQQSISSNNIPINHSYQQILMTKYEHIDFQTNKVYSIGNKPHYGTLNESIAKMLGIQIIHISKPS